MNKILLFFFLSLATFSCADVHSVQSDSKPVTHEKFTSLLQKHVDSDGMVDYKGFIADSAEFNAYLSLLETHHPNEKNWSKDEQLAYWINAYNAFTIRLIIRNYPVESIKDLGGSIYRVNTPWDIKFINIEGNAYHLNNIEHSIIRKQYDEPRIHFALVCAAISCPKLRNEAFEAARLESQLEDQARHFFNSQSRNQISPNAPKVSKLMDWYGGDFKNHAASIPAYINKYSKIKIAAGAKLDYLDYRWELNAQK
jgi:hypothetical protein